MSRRVVVVRTALLFVALNLAIAVALQLRELLPARFAPLGPVASRIGLDRLASAYPELSREDLTSFLAERARVNRWEYEAFTDFRAAPVRGRFVNVTEDGYRRGKDQGPWPPRREARNVFVFGGSTAYGDGLPDELTLPSALQEILSEEAGPRVFVYNFARPAYYGAQERILFEQLLLSGLVPDAAVFVDGLNEGFQKVESPEHPRWSSGVSDRLAPLVDEVNRHELSHAFLALLRALPVTHVGLRLLSKGRTAHPAPLPDQIAVGARWLANRRLTEAVATRFGVRVLFAWHPIPVYRYDLRHHLPGGNFDFLLPMAETYATLERKRVASPDDWKNVVWLAGLQEGRKENFYVDEVHFTARFCRELATEIAKPLRSELEARLEPRGLGESEK